MIETDFYLKVISLFDRFIEDVEPEMYVAMRGGNAEDVKLMAPQFVIDIFYKALTSWHLQTNEKLEKHLIYKGIQIAPVYEMAIIIFHKDYPLHGKHAPWMIKKIPLAPPIHLKKEWWDETIVIIKQYFAIGNELFESN